MTEIARTPTGKPKRTIAKAEMWFAFYYVLGPSRSIKKVAEYGVKLGLKVHVNTLLRYSVDYHWQDRVAELNIVANLEKDQATLETIEDMEAWQAQMGRHMQLVAATKIEGYLDILKGRGVLEIDPRDIIRLASEGVKIERLARGVATERQEIAVGVINAMTVDIVQAFLTVNEIADVEERKRRFAELLDSVQEKRLLESGR